MAKKNLTREELEELYKKAVSDRVNQIINNREAVRRYRQKQKEKKNESVQKRKKLRS